MRYFGFLGVVVGLLLSVGLITRASATCPTVGVVPQSSCASCAQAVFAPQAFATQVHVAAAAPVFAYQAVAPVVAYQACEPAAVVLSVPTFARAQVFAAAPIVRQRVVVRQAPILRPRLRTFVW